MRPPQLGLLRSLGLGQRPRRVRIWRDKLDDATVGEDELERVDVIARQAECAREEARPARREERGALPSQRAQSGRRRTVG